MPHRIVRELGKGAPLSRIWVAFAAVGATGCGILSVPSTGLAVALVPLFLAAGVLCLAGCFASRRHPTPPPLLRGRTRIMSGLALMTVTAWCRAIVLWGLDQRGAGAAVLASFVWVWIAAGCIMLMIAVWARGIQ